MSALDMDLRTRIVKAYQSKEGSQREIAERFSVSASVVCKLNKQSKETGCLQPLTRNNHGVRKVTPEVEEKLRKRLERNPDATLSELRDDTKTVKALSTISLALKRLGLSNKKNETA